MWQANLPCVPFPSILIVQKFLSIQSSSKERSRNVPRSLNKETKQEQELVLGRTQIWALGLEDSLDCIRCQGESSSQSLGPQGFLLVDRGRGNLPARPKKLQGTQQVEKLTSPDPRHRYILDLSLCCLCGLGRTPNLERNINCRYRDFSRLWEKPP